MKFRDRASAPACGASGPAAAARAPAVPWRALRQLMPLAIGAACLWLLAQRLQGFDTDALTAAWQQIAAPQWLVAALATAASFWAVGRYDVVVHRHLGTPLAETASAGYAARAGMQSIALAQTVGLGVITGALARWRALPGLSLADCTRISALVAVSFLAAWSVVTALACLILPAPLAIGAAWTLPLFAALALAGLALVRPRLALWRGLHLTLPSLPAMVAVLWLTFLDTLAAGLALHALMPAGLALDFTTLYPVFLLALGAALLSGTPGGVGPFELALLSLLPHLPEPDLMAAVLGFRLIYYALPAALAALMLAWPRNAPRSSMISHAATRAAPRPGLRDLAHARRAELGVARQNGGRLLATPQASGITIETGQTVTLLFDPALGDMSDLLAALRARARSTNRIPVLYKCSARSAVAARRAGFRLWHVADEAVLDPTRFDLATRHFRQLRRKLRQADKAGVQITRAVHLPLAEMARIDGEWRARQGDARGLTMGRFDAGYLSHHQVFLAHAGTRLQGFVSLHASAHELCLDIMRSGHDAPPGTMQALVAAAIKQAAANGRRRLSLASVPALGRAPGPFERRLRQHVFKAAGGPGLVQFKASFAPRFEPLYLAAPTAPGFILAAADLALSVRADRPAHDDPEQFPIARTVAM